MRKLFNSFSYALSGVIYCIKNERNFRIHLVAALYLLYFSKFYAFSKAEFNTLLITIMLVLFAEITNTAIETAVNILSPQYHRLAKISKDVAAAAVLCCAVISVIVGINLFWNTEIIKQIIAALFANIYTTIIFIIFIILSLVFIFSFPEDSSKWHEKDGRKK